MSQSIWAVYAIKGVTSESRDWLLLLLLLCSAARGNVLVVVAFTGKTGAVDPGSFVALADDRGTFRPHKHHRRRFDGLPCS
jgi:hypothetical protein